jgi:hypothetical protein
LMPSTAQAPVLLNTVNFGPPEQLYPALPTYGEAEFHQAPYNHSAYIQPIQTQPGPERIRHPGCLCAHEAHFQPAGCGIRRYNPQ